MQIKFKTQASALTHALSIVGTVTPGLATPQGYSGYLFVVRGERCFLYSRDSLRVARADFPIEPIEGEGAFIYPADRIKLLELAGDGAITFTATVDEKASTFKVAFQADSGAKDNRSTYDPRLMTPCDKEVEAAGTEKTFPVGILKEALRQARPFMLEDSDNGEEHFKTSQIFDASKPEWEKGDGTLYAATGSIAFYFQSEAFVGKGLAIHGQHLPFVTSFLGQCKGDVTIRQGPNMTFAIDEDGHVLGWTHHDKTHGKYVYYGLSNETFVFDVPVAAALSALRYMQAGLPPKKDKIRVQYSAASPQFTFWSTDAAAETNSFPVPVLPHADSKPEDLQFFVNILDFTHILADAKGDRVMMRIAVMTKNDKRPKDTAMIRTIDSFLMDKDGKIVAGSEESKPEGAFACRVTRFVSSMT